MNFSEVISGFSNVSVVSLAMAFILSLVTVILGSLLFCYFSYALNKRVNFKDSLKINYISLLTNYMVPFKPGALAVKALLTKIVSGVGVEYATLIIIMENVFYYLWQIPLAAALLAFSGMAVLGLKLGWMLAIGIFIVLLIVFILHPEGVFWFRILLPKRILRRHPGIDDVMGIIKDSRNAFVKPGIIIPLILISLMLIFISPLFVKLAESVITNRISYIDAVVIFWISYAAGRLSIIADGFGTKDIAMGGLLIYYGVGSLDAVKIVVLFRIFTALPVSVIGGCYLITIRKKLSLKQMLSAKPEKPDKA